MFVANISFLFTELPFLDRFEAAARAGFSAVECHWPYDHELDDLRAAMRAAGLPLTGINTAPGRPGEFGLAALPGREAEFALALEEALDYAHALDVATVHVMAGVPDARLPRAEIDACYRSNLALACPVAEALAPAVTLLIEPINSRDVPGYALASTEMAREIVEEVGDPRLRILFDAYHVQIMEGDVSRRFETLLPLIGHVQIAAVPDRGEPDDGELDHRYLLRAMRNAGYAGRIAAEYRPRGTTAEGLSWMRTLAG